MLRRWEAARQDRENNRAAVKVTDRLRHKDGDFTKAEIRAWTDEQLIARLKGTPLHHVSRGLAEQELKRREAWAAPAGKAYWISIAALAVSFCSLIVAALKR
jgi:hypothetical protein